MLFRSNCIKKVKEYIEEHFTENILLDDIAKIAGYSKFHLNRLFLENTGLTIYQYIKERRLLEAANQLISTEKSIIEIAFCVGYTSQQAFTFAFKQKFLCTPQTFRKNFYICEMKKTFQINRNNRNAFFMLKNGGMTA